VLESLQVSLHAADCATRTDVAGERYALRNVSSHQGAPLCRGLVTGTMADSNRASSTGSGKARSSAAPGMAGSSSWRVAAARVHSFLRRQA